MDFTQIKDLPSEGELTLVTMCGHGLISVTRIRRLTAGIRKVDISANEAARDIAAPLYPTTNGDPLVP